MTVGVWTSDPLEGWDCGCPGGTNRIDYSRCNDCGTQRPPFVVGTWDPRGSMMWCCRCDRNPTRDPYFERCRQCSTLRPAPSGDGVGKPRANGGWECRCQTKTDDDPGCPRCGAVRPEPSPPSETAIRLAAALAAPASIRARLKESLRYDFEHAESLLTPQRLDVLHSAIRQIVDEEL